MFGLLFPLFPTERFQGKIQSNGGVMVKPIKPVNNNVQEQITLEEARLHLRLDATGSPPTHPDDDLVDALITAARESAQIYTGVAIASQTYQLALDAFPAADIQLDVWPVSSITSITYVDQNGATQTLASTEYGLDEYNRPSHIHLKYQKAWPSTRAQPNAVLITFVAGFTDHISPNTYPTPLSIKQAMLLTIGHLYANREAINVGNIVTEIPLGATYLLTQHRINLGV